MNKKKLQKAIIRLEKDVKDSTDWPSVVCRTKELRKMLKYLRKLEKNVLR